MLTQLASCTDMAGQLVDMISDVTRHAVPATSQADRAPPMHIARIRAMARARAKRANPSVDPRGPISLFVPGGLTLDGRVQHMYNDFLFDVPHPGATGRLYLITRGKRVGVFADW